MSKIRKWWEILCSSCEGWWSLMSGALSIPFAFVALILASKPAQENHQQQAILFASLAFISLWVLVARMAYANYKRLNKDSVNRTLSLYFRDIDAKITLLKYYKKEGVNAITQAGDVLIEGGELCKEIHKFIEENIGQIEATVFFAQNDVKKLIENTDKSGFYDSAITFLTGRLLKLKEIMVR
jgi:hypothetical protein